MEDVLAFRVHHSPCCGGIDVQSRPPTSQLTLLQQALGRRASKASEPPGDDDPGIPRASVPNKPPRMTGGAQTLPVDGLAVG